MVTFKIVVVPGEVREFISEDNTTIEKAIQDAGIRVENMLVRVDGDMTENLSAPVRGGQLIMVASGAIKGAW